MNTKSRLTASSSSSLSPRRVQVLVNGAVFCCLYLLALTCLKGPASSSSDDDADKVKLESSSSKNSTNINHDDSWLSSEARMITPTGSSNYWFLVAAVLATSSLYSYQRLYIPLKPRGLALVGLVISLTCLVPFLVYLYTGVSWSGMELSELHRRMIDSRHAILLFTWSGLSSLQLLGIILFKKLPKLIHKCIGRLAYYIVMPLVLFELHTNAVRVFLPDKPALLCRVVWGIPEPHLWETFLFGVSMAYALLTPVVMGMYWWLALQSIRQRQYHLHMVYSVLLITATSSAGGLRYLFQYFYATSHCEPFRSPETSIAVQSVSLATVPIFYIPLVTIIYCTLPLESRFIIRRCSNNNNSDTNNNDNNSDNNQQGRRQPRRPTVQWSYFFYMGHALTTLVVSGCVGIPSSITCQPPPPPPQDTTTTDSLHGSSSSRLVSAPLDFDNHLDRSSLVEGRV